MLCDICKKKEAVIHIQEISAQGKKVINLCNDCAEKHPQTDPLLHIGGMNFGAVLENIKKISSDLLKKQNIPEDSPVCPQCGWTLSKMDENNGQFGCPECYRTFEDVVKNAVSNIHRSSVHTGKRPKNLKHEPLEIFREKLRKMENALQDAVRAEEYEQAAILRDEINAFKKSRKSESGR